MIDFPAHAGLRGDRSLGERNERKASSGVVFDAPRITIA